MPLYTSKGFRSLEILEYITMVQELRPDIVVGPIDIDYIDGRTDLSAKRRDRMDERTMSWMKATIKAFHETGNESVQRRLWAPILPTPPEVQLSYRETLEEAGKDAFGGLVLYDDSTVLDVSKTFEALPRLSLSNPASPQALLKAVDLGIDLVATSFMNAATDAGIALNFIFPAPAAGEKLPLGYSLWSPAYVTDLSPLAQNCSCYACKSHHRAYVRHLLDAREMLAWVLLQIHNHHQMDLFYSGIRSSIAKGSFPEEMTTFNRIYTDQLPSDGGQGPRLRGYQLRMAEAGPPKINKRAWKNPEKVDPEVIEAARAAKQKQRQNEILQQSAEMKEDDLLILPDFMMD